MKSITLAALLGVAATVASAHEYKLGDIAIDHPIAFETAKTAKVGGGYMTITNAGADDKLLAVTSDSIAKIMLHRSETDANGVARMMHLDAIDLPAGETVELAPGGLHVMFMGLDGDPLEDGEKIDATLVFEKAGEIPVTFNVVERRTVVHGTGAKSDTEDHSNH
ncbi:copper chaperone PCu(A)C [Sulfitobacter sp. S190]|uniref:copper chaperone PCu(A)C n=1 Tax=Sulfitobacter sp. S190 TaxID=2867022 RepID=UPI0021A43644|nr:copper chaperone PCu(A)C [Sulfitobacter sp. S190]UWR23046.1 copper chaperone PCu(A)C [Sulfitobacter sp. S190]